MIKGQPDDVKYIPARILNEYTYCKRLAYLELINGEFEDSAETLEGNIVHRNVDVELIKNSYGNENGGTLKSITLSSNKLKIIAKIDLIEFNNGLAEPVEYKRGAAPAEGAWENDKIQLCAQAIVLRDNGYKCEDGKIYYNLSKKRVTVNFDDSLINKTLLTVNNVEKLIRSRRVPPPLVDSPKCFKCSLVGICLPDEMRSLSRKKPSKQVVRLLYPTNDDRLPMYIQEQGLMITKDGDNLKISKGGSEIKKARLIEISSVSIFGNVQISTQAIRELCKRGITVGYFSYGGWLYGITTGIGGKNVMLKQNQFRVASDRQASLDISRQFIHSKILNCRTLLRRNSKQTITDSLKKLKGLAKMALEATSMNQLLGIEGEAGRVYFSSFNGMLKTDMEFNFKLRNRRPPADPVNALLSFMYALLLNTEVGAIIKVGLDPYMGFLHQLRHDRPSLALDLMEEFRPIIADSVVIDLINSGEIKMTDFITRLGSCALLPDSRKTVISAFERRLEALITHSVFGYKISYRRVIEVQARLLARYLTGEISRYPEFRTR